MALDFFGIDPTTEKDGSPTVWVERETADLVFQGPMAEEELTAEVGGRSWSPGHSAGIPAHEFVMRMPARMVPFIRKACDEAERLAATRGTEL